MAINCQKKAQLLNCLESIKREIGNEEIGDCEYPKTQPTTSVLRNSADLKVDSATVTTPDSAEEVREFRFWSKQVFMDHTSSRWL